MAAGAVLVRGFIVLFWSVVFRNETDTKKPLLQTKGAHVTIV